MSNALSLINTTKIAPVTSIGGGALGATASIINVGVAYYDLKKNQEISLLMRYENEVISETINQIATDIKQIHQDLELIEIQHEKILDLFKKQLEVIKNEEMINSEKEKYINKNLEWIKNNCPQKEYQIALINASQYYISEII